MERSARNFEKDRSGLKKFFTAQMFEVYRPPFLLKNPSDELEIMFSNLDRLFKEGVVVWGAIVQANSLLFQSDKKQSCPAVMVYSLTAPLEIDPQKLMVIASALFDLKGADLSDPGEAAIGDSLAKEKTRSYGIEVPKSVSPDLPCKLSPTFFERKQLPGGCIRAKVMPAVASPVEPYVILPLPSKYWDDDYMRTWMGGQLWD